MKVLLDEMYPPALSESLRAASLDASTAAELGLAGRSDLELFTAAVAGELVVLTENVADFARIATEHVLAGGDHPGVLIALSSRFSRRPAGVARIAAAVATVADEDLGDRLVYLEQPPA
ncbi:MAG TPA: DUF5615 family PIN-like protein [Acidimicrobiales bacterium]|nr:DUF5615 family PIN-like protein [Acidimicrobiales bacterium]